MIMGLGVGYIVSVTTVAHALTIAQDGQARVVIVVARDAPEPEQHAAAELALFLQQITGADFRIVNHPETGKGSLLVGPEAARLAVPEFSADGLGPEGIVVKTAGESLVLAGGRLRGTLYAVYTFLEDQLGCRWWSSTESTIPKRSELELDSVDSRYVPPLEYRSPFWFDAFDGDWAARNKCNGHAHRLDAKRGGRHVYEGFVHTFYSLISPQTHFKDHPEWFSEINGKRTYEHAQLCLTNEPMREELVRNLKARLRTNPAATLASVSQNDWQGNCQCARCIAIEKEEDSPAGLMLRFVNAVAADVEQEFPNVTLSTLAYQYTRRPPKLTRPRNNVSVQLCSIECAFSKPLSDDCNKAFRDDLVGWSKICNRLYIWDYTTNFRHYIMPHPNMRVLGPNVRFFADHHVKGIFEQGAYTSNGAEMAELRAWVLAKLLWNPSLDAQALIDEFINGYYGPAAPHIRAYLNTTHSAVEATGDWLGCFSEHTARFLSFETLSKGWSDLKAAEAAVSNDPDLRFRVQVAELPVLYTFLMRWNEMRQRAQALKADWPVPDSIQGALDGFMQIARKKNVTRLNEWKEGFGALDEAVKRMGSHLQLSIIP